MSILEIGDGVSRGQGEHHVLRAVEGSEQQRDVAVGVGEVLALVGEGQHHVPVQPRGPPAGARQEEGVRPLAVIREVLDQDVLCVQGVGLAPDVVVDVLE